MLDPMNALAMAMHKTDPDGCCDDWSYEPWASDILAALTASGYAVVPVEPSRAMIDAFVARALQVTIHGEGGWSEYARNQWATMLAAANKEPGDA